MISTPQKEAASNQRRRVNSAAFVYIVRRDGSDEQRQPHHCEKRSIDLRKPLLTDPRHRRLNQCDRCEQHQPLVHLGLQIRTAPPAGLVGFTASALNSIITVAARLNAMAAVARRQTFLRKTCADRGWGTAIGGAALTLERLPSERARRPDALIFASPRLPASAPLPGCRPVHGCLRDTRTRSAVRWSFAVADARSTAWSTWPGR